jgi:hypothetical protein
LPPKLISSYAPTQTLSEFLRQIITFFSHFFQNREKYNQLSSISINTSSSSSSPEQGTNRPNNDDEAVMLLDMSKPSISSVAGMGMEQLTALVLLQANQMRMLVTSIEAMQESFVQMTTPTQSSAKTSATTSVPIVPSSSVFSSEFINEAIPESATSMNTRDHCEHAPCTYSHLIGTFLEEEHSNIELEHSTQVITREDCLKLNASDKGKVFFFCKGNS